MAEYISREEVLAAVERWEIIFVPSATHRLIDLVKRIPAADVVERKKGKWIGGELGHCSCCGNEGCFSDIWPDGQERYCPHCGARMEGES